MSEAEFSAELAKLKGTQGEPVVAIAAHNASADGELSVAAGVCLLRLPDRSHALAPHAAAAKGPVPCHP
jgi:hypothetical protein